jgi:hypothetical protein
VKVRRRLRNLTHHQKQRAARAIPLVRYRIHQFQEGKWNKDEQGKALLLLRRRLHA